MFDTDIETDIKMTDTEIVQVRDIVHKISTKIAHVTGIEMDHMIDITTETVHVIGIVSMITKTDMIDITGRVHMIGIVSMITKMDMIGITRGRVHVTGIVSMIIRMDMIKVSIKIETGLKVGTEVIHRIGIKIRKEIALEVGEGHLAGLHRRLGCFM